MSEEKPLNVRVAIALGCSPLPPDPDAWKEGRPIRSCWECPCLIPNGYLREHVTASAAVDHSDYYVANYDTDWEATGPLIEKHVRSLVLTQADGEWQAESDTDPEHHEPGFGTCLGRGDTPLEAICALVLALEADGKL